MSVSHSGKYNGNRNSNHASLKTVAMKTGVVSNEVVTTGVAIAASLKEETGKK